MSPAPGRTAGQPFPHVWAYWLGALIVALGIGVAIYGAVSGIQGFSDDVRDLRRVLAGDALETSLEAGDEIVIYDEADLGFGPFDATVIRTSDGREVATTTVDDGTTYDVDGRSGTARVQFRVPTSDIYRIEVDTSLGQLARFAVGGDVGNDRANTVIAGFVWGGILVLVGFGVFLWTMVLHARWKTRDVVLENVARARSAVQRTTDPALDETQRREAAVEAGDRATSWARQQFEAARAKLPETTGDAGRAPTWRESLAAQARDRIDQLEGHLADVEPALGEAAANADVSDDLVNRVNEALDRIEARVASGERLRDIARDERVVAEETARELADRAQAARAQAAASVSGVDEALSAAASTELEALRSDLADIATGAVDEAVAQVASAGDELGVGLAATAATAAATGAAVAETRARDALGFEIDEPEPELAESPLPASSLPPPPGASSLPAPSAVPSSRAQVAGETLPAPPSVPAPVDEADLEAAVAEAFTLEYDELAAREVDAGALGRAAPEVDTGVLEPAAPRPLLPPPQLAPPPTAHRRVPVSAGRDEPAPGAVLDSFSALAPPPQQQPILAPPPAAVAAQRVQPPSASEPFDTDGDRPGDTDSPEVTPETGFSLAPPPDYSSLRKS